MVNWSQATGAKLYNDAKKIIPGGTQLLSKRPEMFLPDQWPSYYSKAKGCRIWDMDGREFVDMTTNGIGACLLGFADDDVNKAVSEVVEKGSMCTLNTPYEVALARKLCELHPWADMVRYARTGGEIMAVAVRIARAFTGRDKIAVCGYHGWSDWYVAANLSDGGSLDNLLLPGLEPNGVPKALGKTIHSFHYNKIDELKKIIDKHGSQLGAIVMEPIRDKFPEDDFLYKVRELADCAGAVLIFDEITAGWRFDLGGSHKMLGVQPDMAVFAKTISNGYPMAAVIGSSDVMQAAQSSFISSTYWTEAIGPATALATIEKMQKNDVVTHIHSIGRKYQETISELGSRHDINLQASGQYPLSHMSFDYGEQSKTVMTLFTQYMLDKGYFATGAFYPTLAHNDEVLNGFFESVDEVFTQLKKDIDADEVSARLNGPVAHSGFKRLT